MRKILSVITLGAILSSCNTMNNVKTMEHPSEWKKHTNIYEVNVRQYTKEGTFRAFQKELPRLKEMGVKALWFMPITPIAQKNKKGSLGSPYAAQDYTAINPEFGSLEDFKSLVKEAHNQGFKVIIDWVANHTGWDHIWTKTHPEYYLIDPKTKDFQIASGMEDIIELDYQKPELRKAMIEAMKFWVKETDIDGFRCDLASWVEVDFWKEARPELDKVKPLFWLGEYDELENPEYGKTFDASYSWTWMHKTKDYYEGKISLQDLKSLLKKYSDIPQPSMRAWFTTNHDENSWNGTEYEKYGVIAKPLAVFSVTWDGVPLLYSGQELPNHKRLEFFEKDPIAWNGQYALANFYKKLLTLKSNHPALRGGTTRLLKTSAEDKILAFSRKNGEKEVLVLLNLSKEKVDFTLQENEISGKYKSLFSGIEKDFSKDKNFHFEVSDYAVFVK